MEPEWWRSFFDRTYTRLWSAAGFFDHGTAEIEGIQQLLRAHLGTDVGLRILDVPCGFGRHSFALHKAGHHVTGLDLSADQLAMATQDHPGPVYVRGDMRTPPAGPFDAVLNLFSSIGYFCDDAEEVRALQAWHDVLVPGGLLVIETNHRDRIAVIHSPGEELPVGATGAVELGTMDWATGIMHRRVRLADGQERPFTLRVYAATELIALVRRAGFDDVTVTGGWDGAPLGPQTRLVLTARRPR